MEFELHSLGVMPGCRHDNIVWLPSDSHAVANASIISEAWFASVRAKAGWAPDYMHALDLGIGQDLVGGALHHCLQFMPGANRSQRLAALWAKLRTWYKAHRTPTQLGGLTYTMLKRPGQPARLHSKAAECRCVQPFALELVEEFLGQRPTEAILVNLKQAMSATQPRDPQCCCDVVFRTW